MKRILFFFSFSAHQRLSQEPHVSITTLQLISEYPLLSLDLFLFKELIPFQHICKWPSDVFYNLVNYCFSRQDSRDPEHTWPEGTYLNNCFSCCTQRKRKGEGGELRQIYCNAVFHLLKCQLKSRLQYFFTRVVPPLTYDCSMCVDEPFSGSPSSLHCVDSRLESRRSSENLDTQYSCSIRDELARAEFLFLWPCNCHYTPPPCQLHMALHRLPLYVKHMLLLQCLSIYQ